MVRLADFASITTITTQAGKYAEVFAAIRPVTSVAGPIVESDRLH